MYSRFTDKDNRLHGCRTNLYPSSADSTQIPKRELL